MENVNKSVADIREGAQVHPPRGPLGHMGLADLDR
jgi:hypothetical protein